MFPALQGDSLPAEPSGKPGGTSDKGLVCRCRRRKRHGFNPWVGKSPWQLIPVFLPGELHAQRSLVGYSPWGCKESDTTERLTCASESRSLVSDSLRPHGLNSPWNSPGQNIGVGSLSFLQQIFLTQESTRGLLHCRQILEGIVGKFFTV